MDHRRHANNRGCAKAGVDAQKQFENSEDSLFKPQKNLE